uniref:Uncharacterized protein n=1 Tax=Psilocybe cubensis TaxID=181762 RepID=A0A8H8CFB1_PSICU
MEKLLTSLSLEEDEDDGAYESMVDIDGDQGLDDEFLGDDDDDLDVEDDYGTSNTDVELTLPTEKPPPYYPGITTCIVCQDKPAYNKNGKSYPTCGLKCAAILQEALGSIGSTASTSGNAVAGPSTPRASAIRTPQRAVSAFPASVASIGTSSSPTTANSAARVKLPQHYPSLPHMRSPQTSVTTDPNIKLLSQHLGGQPLSPRRGRGNMSNHYFPVTRANTTTASSIGSSSGTMTVVQDPFTPPRAPVVKCVVGIIANRFRAFPDVPAGC